MLCYRDMTFCASDCVNTQCFRHFGEEQREGAQKWWERSVNFGPPPVAFSDFRHSCPDYMPPSHHHKGQGDE